VYLRSQYTEVVTIDDLSGVYAYVFPRTGWGRIWYYYCYLPASLELALTGDAYPATDYFVEANYWKWDPPFEGTVIACEDDSVLIATTYAHDADGLFLYVRRADTTVQLLKARQTGGNVMHAVVCDSNWTATPRVGDKVVPAIW